MDRGTVYGLSTLAAGRKPITYLSVKEADHHHLVGDDEEDEDGYEDHNGDDQIGDNNNDQDDDHEEEKNTNYVFFSTFCFASLAAGFATNFTSGSQTQKFLFKKIIFWNKTL